MAEVESSMNHPNESDKESEELAQKLFLEEILNAYGGDLSQLSKDELELAWSLGVDLSANPPPSRTIISPESIRTAFEGIGRRVRGAGAKVIGVVAPTEVPAAPTRVNDGESHARQPLKDGTPSAGSQWPAQDGLGQGLRRRR
ncbi:hypothetical protein J8273_8253 [Carpediemonas membranifera]|uniref:Uncharacterized protein n=1 Tax=Carpediemonas membranifera TaxID=201153 RepID=A0A8J6AWQ4_9EUKA|nr:hypothetical protein J8273_8253 [Carpediemonas membranifera]|eukprot:KAG9390213.1 hypothetical protein J8273_8253 [Carpediemonas membranifera]